MSLAMIFAPALAALSASAQPAVTTPAFVSATPSWLASSSFEPRTSTLEGVSDPFGYLRLNAGLVTTTSSDGAGGEEIDFDEGYLLALAIGRSLTSSTDPVGFALELEGVWTDQDADSSITNDPVRDISALSGLLNGVVDFQLADRLCLYGAGGIGASWVDVGTGTNFDSEDGPLLAWQLKAGLSWTLSSNTALMLGYRFMNIDDVNIDDSVSTNSFNLETQQHTLELGIQFGF